MPKSATRERTLTFLSLSVPTWRFSEGLIFIVSPNLAKRPFTNKQVSNWVLAHTCLGHLLPFSFQFCFMHCETIKAWWSRPRIPWQAFLGPKQQTRSVQVEACRHTFWTLAWKTTIMMGKTNCVLVDRCFGRLLAFSLSMVAKASHSMAGFPWPKATKKKCPTGCRFTHVLDTCCPFPFNSALCTVKL